MEVEREVAEVGKQRRLVRSTDGGDAVGQWAVYNGKCSIER
jgi:hypothetical protein